MSFALTAANQVPIHERKNYWWCSTYVWWNIYVGHTTAVKGKGEWAGTIAAAVWFCILLFRKNFLGGQVKNAISASAHCDLWMIVSNDFCRNLLTNDSIDLNITYELWPNGRVA